MDSFVVQLSSPAAGAQGQGAFPKSACLVATDFAAGGAVDRRELFFQDRVRQGIAACLDALDAKGATSAGAAAHGGVQLPRSSETTRGLKDSAR